MTSDPFKKAAGEMHKLSRTFSGELAQAALALQDGSPLRHLTASGKPRCRSVWKEGALQQVAQR